MAKKAIKNGNKMQYNKGAKAPVQFMKANKGKYDIKDTSFGTHTEKGAPAAVRRAAKANRTGFGSKNVGADIDGGIE